MGGMKQAMTNCTRKGGTQPTVAGKAASKEGRAAGYRAHQMPMCNYGAACVRQGCIYRHPPKGGPVDGFQEICRPFLANACQFGAKCYNKHPDQAEAQRIREQFARIQCRWGTSCRTQHCLYSHGDDFYQGDSGLPEHELETLNTMFEALPGTVEDGCPPCCFEDMVGDQEQGSVDVAPFQSQIASGWCPQSSTEGQNQILLGADRPLNVYAREWVPSNAVAISTDLSLPSSGMQNLATEHAALPWPYDPLGYDPLETYGYEPSPYEATASSVRSECQSIWAPDSSTYRPAPGSWAAVAVAAPRATGNFPQVQQQENSNARTGGRWAVERTVPVPSEIWVADVERIDAASAFSITDPLIRFNSVNEPYTRRLKQNPIPLMLSSPDERGLTNAARQARTHAGATVLDLHYQVTSH